MKKGDYIVVTWTIDDYRDIKVGHKYRIIELKEDRFFTEHENGGFYIDNEKNWIYKYKLYDREDKLKRILNEKHK